MRMGCFLFSGAFWGILLIVLGVLLLVRVVFNINIPVFRILFALLLIYLGIKVLVGGFGGGLCRDTVLFEESRIEATERSPQYRVIFGKGEIDLSGISLDKGSVRKEVDVVFGSAVVTVDPGMPARIVVNAAFAGARVPDGNVISFGRYTYQSSSFKEGGNYLDVNANVVFGGLEVVPAPQKR